MKAFSELGQSELSMVRKFTDMKEGYLVHVEKDGNLDLRFESRELFVLAVFEKGVNANVNQKIHKVKQTLQIILKENSHVNWTLFQTRSETEQSSELCSNASLSLNKFFLGQNQFVGCNIMTEQNACVDFSGLCFSNNDVNIAITNSHKAPHTKSSMIVKNVAKDNADIECKGLIQIDSTASQADGSQELHSLMIGKAKSHVDPQLEVKTHDVRCTHAASTGQIDEDELFYLRSRGLSLDVAKTLLVESFLDPVFGKHKEELLQLIGDMK